MPGRQKINLGGFGDNSTDNRLKPQTLYPKKSSALWLLLVCLLFVIAGIWMGNSNGWIGYACAVFFGLGIPIALIQLLPGSSYLRLDETGLVIRHLFRDHRVLWQDVDQFFVVGLKQTGITVYKVVGFNFVPSYDRQRIARHFAIAIGKCEGALPETYGMSAEELADKLNSYLRRALAMG